MIYDISLVRFRFSDLHSGDQRAVAIDTKYEWMTYPKYLDILEPLCWSSIHRGSPFSFYQRVDYCWESQTIPDGHPLLVWLNSTFNDSHQDSEIHSVMVIPMQNLRCPGSSWTLTGRFTQRARIWQSLSMVLQDNGSHLTWIMRFTMGYIIRDEWEIICLYICIYIYYTYV